MALAMSGIVVPVEPKKEEEREKSSGKGGRITLDLGDSTLSKVRQDAGKAGISPEDLIEKIVDAHFELPNEKRAEFAKKGSLPIV